MGFLQRAALLVAENFLIDHLGRGGCAGVESTGPEEILVVTQTAAPRFDIGLLHEDAGPVASSQFLKVLDSESDVVLLLAADA